MPPIPKKLPPCAGPKLDMFLHDESRIQWMERIDKDVTSSKGYVFKAHIGGRGYAIKVIQSTFGGHC
ncbi:hypothetical protein FOXB_00402 [Fusarium oxysporum f. sp. conglutinans Fo5176]|uniref:Uncharacterized protein n=1 Tax=Fusarium oxysporum (strain Fo5176) TaxID=660025 RepID=F9F1X8_FUSOF|nr:hypothetical protein FOXB_00402 [Fusarium oxysporum f. sp. conglutinans Fo5176]